MDAPLVALTLVTVLGCGLSAGVFFAFSGFVMKALARLPAAHGIAAMQAINVAAVSVAFMLALFGTAAACVALGGWALAEWGQPFAPYLLAGSALYLAGVIAESPAGRRAAGRHGRDNLGPSCRLTTRRHPARTRLLWFPEARPGRSGGGVRRGRVTRLDGRLVRVITQDGVLRGSLPCSNPPGQRPRLQAVRFPLPASDSRQE